MTILSNKIGDNNNCKKTKRLYTKAAELYFNHDFKQAKITIDKLNKINNEPNLANLELHACIEFDLGQTEKGLALINQAISLTPNHKLYTTKGIFYQNINRFEEALECFEESLSLNNYDNQSTLHIAEIQLYKLNINDAYLLLRKEKNNLPSHQQRWRFLFNQCLSNIKYLKELPLTDLHDDLIDYFSEANTSLKFIGNLCYPLILTMQKQENLSLKENQLLLCCLNNGIITDRELETSLALERKRILQTSLSQLNIHEIDIPLASALAINAYYNEYIIYYDQQEKSLIQELNNIIQGLAKEKTSVVEISGFILLYIMYEPINTLNINNYIEDNTNHECPTVLKNIIQWSIVNPLIENELKANINQLDGDQATRTSTLVQQQYEENPYPRWIKLHHSTIPIKYAQVSKALQENARDIAFLELPKLQVFVAGCGTGEHPLILSKIVQIESILAIDISLASLAYAQRMCNEYQVKNIQFMQADILNLASLNKTFHIIETVGVLHHMKNPEQGLEILLNLLKPKGIIKIALYSTIARQKIIQLRELNNTINMLPTKENMQMFRSALLNNSQSEYYSITEFMDFYSTSSCRDLLFNRQEHTYTIPQLKELFKKFNLRFIGFQHHHHILEHYKSIYPDDPSTLNLDNWHNYEQEYPETFRGMYQFHCQANK